MYKAVPSQEYNNGKHDFSPIAFVKDLFDDQNLTETPTAPALAMRLDLDGTKSPSYDGATVLPEGVQVRDSWVKDKNNQPTTLKYDMRDHPVTDKNSPTFGEFDNAIPLMYLDMDPTSKFKSNLLITRSSGVRVKTLDCDELVVGSNTAKLNYLGKLYST